MEPVVFGNKRALLVKPGINSQNNYHSQKLSRHSQIIENLRNFISVRMWERKNNNWSYDSLQNLKQNPYIIRPVPEKRNKKGCITSCTDYFFFLTTIQNRRICCFIEKKKPLEKSIIYQVRFRFKDELFKGTLLTGTLLMSEKNKLPEREDITYHFSNIFQSIKREVSAPVKKKNWMFVINDMWAISGKDMSSLLSQRLVYIQDLIGKDWYPDPKLDVCDFELTYYNNYNSIEDFLRNKRKYFPYTLSDNKVVVVCTQGIPGADEYSISLTDPIPKPLISETITFKNGEWDIKNVNDEQENIIKTDNKKEQKLFLKMSDYPDVYWVYEPKTWKKLGVARVRTIVESKHLKQLFEQNKDSGKDYLKLQFKWIQEFEKWQPILHT